MISMCWKVRRVWLFGREECLLTSNYSMHCPLQRVYVIPSPTSLFNKNKCYE